MPMTRRPWLIPVLMTFAALVIAGCGGSGDSGGATVEVPSVAGKPVAEARAAITGVGLKVLVQRGANAEPAGKVVHQGTPAGSKVPENTSVTLYVSSGPAARPAAPPVTQSEATPAPSPREVAKAQTINCLQSIPLLKVDTSGGPLAEIEVHADVPAGGGNAMITVFPSHAGALKYSRTFNSGAVGNLAGAIYNYKGSQDFQAAVEGCLH